MKNELPPLVAPNGGLDALVQTLLVAVVFVLASRIWPVDEHIVFLSVFFALVALALRSPQDWVRPRLLNLVPLAAMIAIFVILIASPLWAPEAPRSLSYAGFSFLHFLIGAAVAVAIPFARIFAGVLSGAMLVGLHSLYVSVTDPSRGVVEGLYLGEFTNQSELSHLLGLGFILVVAFLSRRWWVNGLVVLAGLLLGIYVVSLGYLTTAVSIAAALWVYAGIFVVRAAGDTRKRSVSFVFGALTAALAVFAWTFRAPLQVFAGKTPDFSGRTWHWSYFWGEALERPWLGLGWGWTIEGWSTEEIIPVQEFFPAHNGYIEIAYLLGIPAMVLLVIAVSFSAFLAFAGAVSRNQVPWIASALPAFVIYLAVHDLASTSFTRTIGFFVLGVSVVLVANFSQKDFSVAGKSRTVVPGKLVPSGAHIDPVLRPGSEAITPLTAS